MRVLHIINNLASGGAEKLIEETLPLFNNQQGVETELLLLSDKKDAFLEALKNKKVPIVVIKYRSIYDPRNVFEIKKYIAGGSFDIVHSHTFPTQMWVSLARLILRNRRVKFITTEHSTHNRRREKFYFRLLDKLIYSQYDSIISITEKTRDNLINWIDPKHKRLDKHVVIENGVDIKKIKEAMPYEKSKLIEGITENTKLVCMVGRFSEAKDQPTLIRATSKLAEDIHLVLVGEGPLMSDNIELAKKLNISDRVHFLGFRQDIPRLLKTVDIVVLSSHWEGFGLAAVEGMAAGKPVIASDVDGLNNVVNNYDLKFKVRDYNKLSQIIYLLVNNENYYLEKSKEASIQCERYDINRVIKEYLKTYF